MTSSTDGPRGEVTDWPRGEVTVTQRLIRLAAPRGGHLAFAAGPGRAASGYADLAASVQAVAAGLAWRGLRPGDAVGVYIPDAARYALATHAVRAAGGVPTPVAAGLTIPQIAAQLADCGARMLLTGPPLAAAALAAADRSWVRQVISFGEAPGAEPSGAIPAEALSAAGILTAAAASPQDRALLPYVRKPDGGLAADPVSHEDMARVLRGLDSGATLREEDVVVAAPPAGDGRWYTLLLDHALLCGATVVAAGTSDLAAAAEVHHATAVIRAGGMAVGGRERPRVLAVAP